MKKKNILLLFLFVFIMLLVPMFVEASEIENSENEEAIFVIEIQNIEKDIQEQTITTQQLEDDISFPEVLCGYVQQSDIADTEEIINLENLVWELVPEESTKQDFVDLESEEGDIYVYKPILPTRDSFERLIVYSESVVVPRIYVYVTDESSNRDVENDTQSELEISSMMVSNYTASDEDEIELPGSGTYEEPYCISSLDDLVYFQTLVNSGQSFKEMYISLIEDIYINDVEQFDSWLEGSLPNNEWGGINGFDGTFEGNNHTIYGLFMDSEDDNTGFFNIINKKTKVTIRNLNFEKAYVCGTNYVGVIVGQADWLKIDNCSVSGVVKGTGDNIGGFVGYSGSAGHYGTSIANSINYSTVYGENNVGGIIGYSLIGNNVGLGPDLVGGDAKIELNNLENKGMIYGNGTNVGGIAGYLQRCMNCGGLNVYNLTNWGEIEGNSCVGGNIGYLASWIGSLGDTIVDCCSNHGKVSGVNVAGIFGKVYWGGGKKVCLTNMYNVGDITSSSTSIAGIIGWANGGNCLSHAFNVGKLIASSSGAIVGPYPVHIELKDSYYYVEEGDYNTTNGGQKISSEQLKKMETFIEFDFENVWFMGNDFPVLRCQYDMESRPVNNFKPIDRDNLPKLSEDDALMFLKMIYNTSKDISLEKLYDEEYMNLLTGKYDSFESDEELRHYVWAFSTFVRASLDVQTRDSSYRAQYCINQLYDYLITDLEVKNIIEDDVMDYVQDFVKQLSIDFDSLLGGAMAKTVSLSVKEGALLGITTALSSVSEAEQYVERVVEVICTAYAAQNQDVYARSAYFLGYLGARGNFESPEDDIFTFIMDCTSFTIQHSSVFDDFLWIGGKSPWIYHVNDINRWAETLFLLEERVFEKENPSDVNVNNSSILESGSCGEKIVWVMYKNGIFALCGEGKMDDFQDVPVWRKYGSEIERLVIGAGITDIGDNSFAFAMPNLKEIVFPSSVILIGQNAFSQLQTNINIKYENNIAGWVDIDIQNGNDMLVRNYDWDCDYIPDDWERYGVDYDKDGTVDLPLNLMGADPFVKDVFVEIDWMVKPAIKFGPNVTLQPKESLAPTFKQLKMVYEAFEKHNINLHLDAGPDSYDFVTGNKWGEYGKGNEIEYTRVFNVPSTYLKDGYMNQTIIEEFGRYPGNLCGATKTDLVDSVFKYCIFFDRFKMNDSNSPSKSSGAGFVGRIDAPFFFVSNNIDGRKGGSSVGDISVAGTFMHELGHTLGLNHGGNSYDEVNYKPNYLSVMNYSFQFIGIPGRNEIDFSGTTLPTLLKEKLDEKSGIDNFADNFLLNNNEGTIIYNKKGDAVFIENASRNPIDFNCNGSIDEQYVEAPINEAKGIKPNANFPVLIGFNDWDYVPYYHTIKSDYYAFGKTFVDTIETIDIDQSVYDAAEKGIFAIEPDGFYSFAGPYMIIDSNIEQRAYFDVTNCNNYTNEYTLEVGSNGVLSPGKYDCSVGGADSSGLQKSRISVMVNQQLMEGEYEIPIRLFCGEKELIHNTVQVSVKSLSSEELEKILSSLDVEDIDNQVIDQYKMIIERETVSLGEEANTKEEEKEVMSKGEKSPAKKTIENKKDISENQEVFWETGNREKDNSKKKDILPENDKLKETLEEETKQNNSFSEEVNKESTADKLNDKEYENDNTTENESKFTEDKAILCFIISCILIVTCCCLFSRRKTNK